MMAEDKKVKPVEEEVLAPAAEAEASDEAPKKAPVKRKKAKRTVAHGHIHVLATFNNTIITVTDPKGNVLSSASAGGSGFRGSKKGTAYAAQIASEKAINLAKQANGLSKADVFVKGVGQGRDAAVRTLINQKVQIDSVKDVTPVAHGGVRPRKAKRN
jgi:small subunit ribosomal protein S11